MERMATSRSVLSARLGAAPLVSEPRLRTHSVLAQALSVYRGFGAWCSLAALLVPANLMLLDSGVRLPTPGRNDASPRRPASIRLADQQSAQ